MFVDVILPISLIVVGLVVFGSVLYTQIQTDNELDELLSAVQEELNSPKPFSLAEHYERLIQVSEEIAEEKEKRQYEPTVLWLILDGMRINEDGTIEWIKKPSRINQILEEVKKKEKEREPYEQLIDRYMRQGYSPYTIPSSGLYADDELVFMAGVENYSSEDLLRRIQYNQLQASLNSQIANIQNQIQTQWLIDNLQKRSFTIKPAERSFDAYGRTFEGEPFYSWAQEL